ASSADVPVNQSPADGVSRKESPQQPTLPKANSPAAEPKEEGSNDLPTEEGPADPTIDDRGAQHGPRALTPHGRSKALLEDAAAYLGSNGWRLSKLCHVKSKNKRESTSAGDIQGTTTCASADEEPQSLSKQNTSEKDSSDGDENLGTLHSSDA